MVRQKKRQRLRVLSYRKEGSISKKREKLEYYTMCKNATSGVSQLDNWGTYVDKFVFTVKEYYCKVCKARFKRRILHAPNAIQTIDN